MSMQQHSAATALLADPSVRADPGQSFSTVQRGYHKGEVDDWVRSALSEIDRLGRQVTAFLSHEASSPQGQKLLSELMQLAADEVTGQRAAAVEEIEQMIAGAHQQSDGIIADARRQAEQITGSATQQSSSLISNARADAKKTTDKAEAYAAAVREAAEARLTQLVRLHDDGIARLSQVNEVTGKMLAAESQRGSLADEVTRALAPITSAAEQR